jgi:hypothetical protein
MQAWLMRWVICGQDYRPSKPDKKAPQKSG